MADQSADVVVLYRPAAATELALIEATGMTGFPVRATGWPLFTAVGDPAYAGRLAEVEAGSSGFAAVLRFSLRSDRAAQFEVERIGTTGRAEYRCDRARLDDFNQAIVGPIEIVAEHGQRGA